MHTDYLKAFKVLKKTYHVHISEGLELGMETKDFNFVFFFKEKKILILYTSYFN